MVFNNSSDLRCISDVFSVEVIMIYKMKGENTQNPHPFCVFFNLPCVEADVYTK